MFCESFLIYQLTNQPAKPKPNQTKTTNIQLYD